MANNSEDRERARRIAKCVDDTVEFLKSLHDRDNDAVIYAFELLANAIREEFDVK